MKTQHRNRAEELFDMIRTYEEKWRPWPFNYLGDGITMIIGWIILVLSMVPTIFLLFSSSITMQILKFLKKIFISLPGCRTIPSKYDNIVSSIGKKILKDPRNAPYVPWIFFLVVHSISLLCWAAYRYYFYGFELSTLLIYHLLRLGPAYDFFATQHVLLHKEGHDYNGFFKEDSIFSFFNHWIVQWVLGPIYGQIPNSYRIGHNKIHHRYDNMIDDVHTNIDLDRTKWQSFILYVPRFGMYWLGISVVHYFLKRREYRLASKMFGGMVFYSFFVFFFYKCFGTLFTLLYIIYPMLESISFFSAISYVWHLWIDPDDPTNPYVGSVTILNGENNIWNEDYHVIHHFKQKVHWQSAPDNFNKDIEMYKKHRATLFRDIEAGRLIFFILFGMWDTLANYFVDLSGTMTHEEKKKLLIERAKCTFAKKGEI